MLWQKSNRKGEFHIPPFQSHCPQVNLEVKHWEITGNFKTGSVSWAMMERLRMRSVLQASGESRKFLLTKGDIERWQSDWPPFLLVLSLPNIGLAKIFRSGFSCYWKNVNELLDQPNTNSSVMLTKQPWLLPSSFSLVSLPPSPTLLPSLLLFIQYIRIEWWQ